MTKSEITPDQPTPAQVLERIQALLSEKHYPLWGAARNLLQDAAVTLRAQAAALAEREAECVRLRAIHQEKTKRLGSLRRYVWEQYRRKISEMKDVGRDLDFILAMPLYHPETGAVVTVDESLEIARQALTPTQEAQQ